MEAMMVEIRRTTSIPQLRRELEEVKKLAEKRGLIQQEQPKITGLFDGPKHAKAMRILNGRHFVVDPKTGSTLFTLKLGTPGAVGMPANERDDEPPPEAA
jgi:hypothetical protein